MSTTAWRCSSLLLVVSLAGAALVATGFPLPESAEGQSAPGDTDDVLARIDGEPITLAGYQRFLLRSEGLGRLEEFIDQILLARAAERLRIALPYEEVDREVEARIARMKRIFGGDEEALESSLRKRHLDLRDYRRWLEEQLFWEQTLIRCASATRELTEDEMNAAFEERYGPDRITVELRQIFIDEASAGESGAEIRARAVLRRLESGQDFAELAEKYSHDAATAQNGGRIPFYRRGGLGLAVDRAVSELSPEEPRTLVRGSKGWHVIELLGRKQVTFEEVRDEIARELQDAPLSAAEKVAFFRRLRERVEIVKSDPSRILERHLDRPGR